MSHLAYSILLAQLIPTLKHYPCTVALPGLADWFPFLGWVFVNHVKSPLRQCGPWRTLYGRYGSDIHPCDIKMSLRPSRVVWAYEQHFLDSQIFQTVLLEGVTCLRLPTFPHHPPHPLPPAHPLIFAISDITVVVKKVAQNSAVLASQLRTRDSQL